MLYVLILPSIVLLYERIFVAQVFFIFFLVFFFECYMIRSYL